jgi:hypothetical protein
VLSAPAAAAAAAASARSGGLKDPEEERRRRRADERRKKKSRRKKRGSKPREGRRKRESSKDGIGSKQHTSHEYLNETPFPQRACFGSSLDLPCAGEVRRHAVWAGGSVAVPVPTAQPRPAPPSPAQAARPSGCFGRGRLPSLAGDRARRAAPMRSGKSKNGNNGGDDAAPLPSAVSLRDGPCRRGTGRRPYTAAQLPFGGGGVRVDQALFPSFLACRPVCLPALCLSAAASAAPFRWAGLRLGCSFVPFGGHLKPLCLPVLQSTQLASEVLDFPFESAAGRNLDLHLCQEFFFPSLPLGRLPVASRPRPKGRFAAAESNQPSHPPNTRKRERDILGGSRRRRQPPNAAAK